MATRSVICKETLPKSYVGIYCHWDGYPQGVGKTLFEHYTDKDKVEQLLRLGDISSLEERVEPLPNEFHTYENPVKDVTVAYHRDRGEELNKARPIKLKEAREEYWAEYMYVYKRDGKWYYANLCSQKPRLVLLTAKSRQQPMDRYEYF